MRRILLGVFAVLAVLASGCATLPPPAGRVPTVAFTDTGDTKLGRAAAPGVAANPGESGIFPMPDPHDAFAARVLLARAAEKSIDAQYFLWAGDEVGSLLFEELNQAAQRGVRVRLLIDDYNTQGLDLVLAALAAQPNLELRLYNPMAIRDPRALNYLADFRRVNRRMHNKSFTIDNQVTVVGGRNIANEYFDAGTGVGFADVDVIAVGSVVRAVSSEFDLFWNSGSAYPAADFVGTAPPDAARWLAARADDARKAPFAAAYTEAVRNAPLLQALYERSVDFEWTTAQVVHDDPAKTLDTSGRTDVLLFPELVRIFGPEKRAVDLISPYFVPGDQGTATLAAYAEKGVRIRVLTNSLAATDEASVHAGYAKHRPALLRAGVELWELKPTATNASTKARLRFGASSSSALHAKTFAVDRTRIFIGSFNFDQRSYHLNTEMGLVIDSPVLAGNLARFFDDEVPSLAYEVRLAPDGQNLVWIERTAEGEVCYGTDPGTSWALRAGVGLLSLLPIEWLL